MRKCSLFGIDYSVTDYDEASGVIVEHGKQNKSFGVSALAVHGLMTAYHNATLKEKVNKLDLVVPDGQPVRWALNGIHRVGLADRVYGPELTLWVLRKSNESDLKVYLFGSKEATCALLVKYINQNFPKLTVVGVHPDRFREATPEEDNDDIRKINNSRANIVLVGRGCPRQEVWVSDHLGKVNAAMMAVGAAFDFLAGTSKQAPGWMQRVGLEWLFRLVQEPKRLWRRYLVTNSQFIFLFVKYRLFN